MNRTTLAVTAVAGIFLLSACNTPDTPAPAQTPPTVTKTAPSVKAVPTPSAAPTLAPPPAPAIIVTRIIDGDTIETSAGTVRVIGIDTPEKGECGYEQASANAGNVVPVGSTVTLTTVTGKDDADKYGRILRYVTSSSGTDLGLEQISDGLATARYDSRDGYGAHPKEASYIAMDGETMNFACPTIAPKPTPTKKPVVEPAPVASTPPPPPAPAPAATPDPAPVIAVPDPAPVVAEVYYANCTAARAAGVTPILLGQPGYRKALDREGDGIACE